MLFLIKSTWWSFITYLSETLGYFKHCSLNWSITFKGTASWQWVLLHFYFTFSPVWGDSGCIWADKHQQWRVYGGWQTVVFGTFRDVGCIFQGAGPSGGSAFTHSCVNTLVPGLSYGVWHLPRCSRKPYPRKNVPNDNLITTSRPSISQLGTVGTPLLKPSPLPLLFARGRHQAHRRDLMGRRPQRPRFQVQHIRRTAGDLKV